MTGRRRALLSVLSLAGLALVLFGTVYFLRGSAEAPGIPGASDILVRAARTQMQATEKLLEAVDDINQRLMVLEKMVLRDEGQASLQAPARPEAAEATALLARQVVGLRQDHAVERAALHAEIERQAGRVRGLALLVGGVGLLAISGLLRPRGTSSADGPPPTTPVRPQRESAEVGSL